MNVFYLYKTLQNSSKTNIKQTIGNDKRNTEDQ